MRSLLSIALLGATAVVQCPTGSRVRIVGLNGLIAPGATGDIVKVTMGPTNDPWIAIASNPVEVNQQELAASISAHASQLLVEEINPVTGIASYFTQGATVTLPLPDLWWQQQVQVNVQISSGMVNGQVGQVIYELETP